MPLPRPRSICAALICTIGYVPVIQAIDFNWTGAVDNDWLNGANWNPAGPPSGGNGNHAFIQNGGTPTISANVTDQVQDWFIGRAPGNSGTLNHSAGTASNLGWTFVGTDGGTGTYNLTGAGGSVGSGSFTTGRLYVGGVRDFDGGTGTATVNTTGTLTLGGDLAVGTRGGTGNFTFNSGTIVANTWMIVGETHNGIGGGSGTFNQNGGSIQVGATDAGGRLWLGSQEGSASTVRSAGTYNLNNGTLSTPEIVVGRHYDGTFTQSAGSTTFTTRGAEVGEFGGSIGTVTLSGASTFTQTTPANTENQDTWNHLGHDGTGVFNLSGNAVASFSSRTHIGTGGSGNGTINQTGGVFEVRDHELIIGDSGTANYNISAGTLRTFGTRPINVGNWNNANANLNISGTAQVTTGGNLGLGQAENSTFASSGTVTMTGGTLTVGGDIAMGNNSTQATGTFNLGGGVLDLTGGNVVRGIGSSDFNMTGGVLRNVNSIIGDTLDNTFTLQGGLLEVGALAGAGSSTTINGNFSLLAAGAVKFELAIGSADQLTVNGSVSLAGVLDLDQVGVLSQGATFTLIANDGVDPVVGTFANAPAGVGFTQDGNPYTVYYNAGDGNDVVIVPEPGSAAAFALAALSYGMLSRRRRKS